MLNVAVVGATGLVGEKLVTILAEKLPNVKLMLFANESSGKKVQAMGKTYVVEHVEKLLCTKLDVAMFMANEQVAKTYVPPLANRGVLCVDNSSQFRMHFNVPLVVPVINGNTIGKNAIVANPNCTTIAICTALDCIKHLSIEKVGVVTLQSASGMGKDGLKMLESKKHTDKNHHPLCDNVLPCVGDAVGLATSEERKILDETNKILAIPPWKITAFCTRVPVTVGHSAVLNVELQQDVSVEQFRQCFCNKKGVLLLDDVQNGVFPTPQIIRNTALVAIGRIVKHHNGSFSLFVVEDNLLRGASQNAWEILQIVLKNNGLWGKQDA